MKTANRGARSASPLLPFLLLILLPSLLLAYPFVPPSTKVLKSFREYQEHALSMVRDENNIDGREEEETSTTSTHHSHVEGETYKDRLAELEALGGDAFFLSSDDDDEQEDEPFDNDDITKEQLQIPDASLGGFMEVIGERYATDGKGPTPPPRKEEDPDEEWDGWTIDEEAHLGFNDW